MRMNEYLLKDRWPISIGVFLILMIAVGTYPGCEPKVLVLAGICYWVSFLVTRAVMYWRSR